MWETSNRTVRPRRVGLRGALVVVAVVALLQASASALAVTVPVQDASAGAPGGGSADEVAGGPVVDLAAGARLVELANRDRAGAGLAPLAVRGDVEEVARAHSADMAAAGSIWHNDAYFSTANRERLGAAGLGENVARNGSVDDAHRRLMASPAHRANLLDARFTVVGMAAVRTETGSYFVTQNFVEPRSARPAPTPTSAAPPSSTPPAPPTPPPAPEPVAPAAPAPAPLAPEPPARQPDVPPASSPAGDLPADGGNAAPDEARATPASTLLGPAEATPAVLESAAGPGGPLLLACLMAVAAIAAVNRVWCRRLYAGTARGAWWNW
jgi:uncharacterized protein YkwD